MSLVSSAQSLQYTDSQTTNWLINKPSDNRKFTTNNIDDHSVTLTTYVTTDHNAINKAFETVTKTMEYQKEVLLKALEHQNDSDGLLSILITQNQTQLIQLKNAHRQLLDVSNDRDIQMLKMIQMPIKMLPELEHDKMVQYSQELYQTMSGIIRSREETRENDKERWRLEDEETKRIAACRSEPFDLASEDLELIRNDLNKIIKQQEVRLYLELFPCCCWLLCFCFSESKLVSVGLIMLIAYTVLNISPGIKDEDIELRNNWIDVCKSALVKLKEDPFLRIREAIKQAIGSSENINHNDYLTYLDQAPNNLVVGKGHEMSEKLKPLIDFARKRSIPNL